MTPTPRTITVRVGKPVPAFPNPDDPRPRFAAALVDPMLAATDHPAHHDGPDWTQVRIYIDAAKVAARVRPESPSVANSLRAALALARLLPTDDDARTPAEVLQDTLTDLRHAADALGLDYADLDLSADDCYRAEAEKGDTLA